MNKERLEEMLDDLPYSIRHSGESEPLKQFAREQAERVQELEDDYKVRQVEYLEEHIDRLEQQNKRYREALEEIATRKMSMFLNQSSMNEHFIRVARKALEGEE